MTFVRTSDKILNTRSLVRATKNLRICSDEWFLHEAQCDKCVCVCVCVQAQEACGPLEIDNALSMVRDLEKDMQEAKASAEEGKLKPLPGETVRHTKIVSGCATRELDVNSRICFISHMTKYA